MNHPDGTPEGVRFETPTADLTPAYDVLRRLRPHVEDFSETDGFEPLARKVQEGTPFGLMMLAHVFGELVGIYDARVKEALYEADQLLGGELLRDPDAAHDTFVNELLDLQNEATETGGPRPSPNVTSGTCLTERTSTSTCSRLPLG